MRLYCVELKSMNCGVRQSAFEPQIYHQLAMNLVHVN